MLKERIREILKADKISLYELALDIGISNSSLYSILHDKHKTTPEVMNKVTGYIATYLTKDEKLEGYRLDNEEIIEVNKTLEYKIEQLEQENAELKEENYQLQKDCQICENFIDFIPCKPIRDMDYDLQKVISQRDKYYQTLQEIKEIAERQMRCCTCNFQNNDYKSGCKTCESKYAREIAVEILQIITKAEEE